ncbi:MAG: 50S ribosomal protein L15 [Candidatus Brocadiia bacterium]|jgi:large subunit ribosomal protein L15|nr:50S ribosomal protein L15 [Candidatus Brocadiia bacterium]
MDISEAKSLTHPRKRRKRIGRGHGSGHGKTSGRGMDGARSRSGWSSRGMTGGNLPLFRRLPRVGFSNEPFKKTYTVVNVGRLEVFEPGSEVTPQALRQRGVIKQVSKDGVKVLGTGEVDRPLKVHAHAVSEGARAKIEAAGGSVEIIPGPKKLVRNKMKPRPAARTPKES